ncbi:hypothetical protein BH10BDE1_BH10BDE1_24880 [soil metagenome]
MSVQVGATVCFASFLVIVFSAFFFWNRLVARPESDGDVWSASLVGSMLATALFIICFAIGVWFSIARLRGDGWILSA